MATFKHPGAPQHWRPRVGDRVMGFSGCHAWVGVLGPSKHNPRSCTVNIRGTVLAVLVDERGKSHLVNMIQPFNA